MTDTQGCQPEQIEALAERVRSGIEHCSGRHGGKVSVRVSRGPGGKLTFAVAPDPSLDPREKVCVLDALNKLQGTDDSATAWSGFPNIPPSGFTSLLTIEW